MKKIKTPEKLSAHEAEKLQKSNYKRATTKAKRTMIELCRDKGLRTGEAQLKFAIKNPHQLPASLLLTPEVIIECYKAGIEQYKNEDIPYTK